MLKDCTDFFLDHNISLKHHFLEIIVLKSYSQKRHTAVILEEFKMFY